MFLRLSGVSSRSPPLRTREGQEGPLTYRRNYYRWKYIYLYHAQKKPYTRPGIIAPHTLGLTLLHVDSHAPPGLPHKELMNR